MAAGTVFRVLLIWELSTGAILHRLLGHTGVIFDTLYLRNGAVASVSDDRTVRVWQDGESIAEMYGHSSRIWKLAQLESTSSSDDELVIVTASEDATCKVWSVKREENKEITTLRGHLGKNIRALSTSLGNLIATGGEDGSVKLWNLKQIVSLQKDACEEAVVIKTRIPLPGQDVVLPSAEPAEQQLKQTEKQKMKTNQIKCIRIASEDMEGACPSVFVATMKGTFRKHRLTTDV